MQGPGLLLWKAAVRETESAEFSAELATGEEVINKAGGSKLFLYLFIAAVIVIIILVAALVLSLLWTNKLQQKTVPDPKWNEETLIVNKVTVNKMHNQGKRSSQQDSFAVSDLSLIESHGLLSVVADGMGGLEHGDEVSQIAVQTVMDDFLTAAPGKSSRQLLLYLLQRANTAVNNYLGVSKFRSSGSTIVMSVFKDDEFSYISVGDSRICLFRDGELIQLNREHTYVHDLLLDAINQNTDIDTALTDSQAGGLTSFLGCGQLKYIDLPDGNLKLRARDKIILMSDGVYNALSDQEIISCLLMDGDDMMEILERTILGKQYSNQDNFTAVILEFDHVQMSDAEEISPVLTNPLHSETISSTLDLSDDE